MSLKRARVLWVALIILAIPTAIVTFHLRPWYWFERGATPMTEISGLSDLRTRFDADTGRMRLVLLMSPT